MKKQARHISLLQLTEFIKKYVPYWEGELQLNPIARGALDRDTNELVPILESKMAI